MADLQFREAPDWLLQSYIENKNRNPVVEGLNAAATIAQQYTQAKKQKQSDQLASRKLDATDQELAMKQREQFYNYGDISSLPKDQANQIGQPLEGPPTAEGIGPQKSPVIQHFESFLAQNPQGLKGSERKTNLSLQQSEIDKNNAMADMYGRKEIPGSERPTDLKKTFQLKGFEGNVPVSYDTRTGELVRGQPTTVPLSPTVAPSIPGAEVNKFGDLENLKRKMVVLRKNYSPDLVGMIDAPMQALRQKTGIGATKQAAFFKQTTQDIKDSLLRARSGAQINEQEYQRLLPLVPNETMSEIDFLAKADRFDQVLNEMLSAKQGAFQKAGYRTPNFGGSSNSGSGDPLGIR